MNESMKTIPLCINFVPPQVNRYELHTNFSILSFFTGACRLEYGHVTSKCIAYYCRGYRNLEHW